MEMKQFNIIIEWLNKHDNIAYSCIRIFLGSALFIRGWLLMSNHEAIVQLTGANQWYWWYSYITIIHLTGGLLLSIGFLTRIAAFLQIPILWGAVFFIHFREGLLSSGQSLELSVLVLILLVIYFFFGSTSLSVDGIMAKKKATHNN